MKKLIDEYSRNGRRGRTRQLIKTGQNERRAIWRNALLQMNSTERGAVRGGLPTSPSVIADLAVLSSLLILAMLIPCRPAVGAPLSGTEAVSTTSESEEEEAVSSDSTVSESSGAATIMLPVELPPGPGGFAPQVALEYSSSAGDGLAGVGWDLSFGMIECSSRFGVPDYANCPSFELNGELLTGPDYQGNYHTFVESFQQIKPYGAPSGQFPQWKVHGPDGSVSIYGGTPDSTVYHESGSGIARWYLTRRLDPFGNEIKYLYKFGPGVRHPDKIFYASGRREVRFIYESRPDPIRGYPGGVYRETNRRLREIQVFSNQQLYSRTIVTYDQSPDSGRSLLASLQRFGSDCSLSIENPTPADCSSLPPEQFEYSKSAPGSAPARPNWVETPSADILKTTAPGDEVGRSITLGRDAAAFRWGDRTQAADVNGDGFLDVVVDFLSSSADPQGFLGADDGSGPGDGYIILGDGGDGWQHPLWEQSDQQTGPLNEAALWTDRIRSLRFDLPRFRVKMTEATGGDVEFPLRKSENVEAYPGGSTPHLGVCEMQGIEWFPGSGLVQTGGGTQAITQAPPYYSGTDFKEGDTYSDVHDADARLWPNFHIVDLNSDGLADLVMSMKLTGAHRTLVDCERGARLPRGQEQWSPGATVRVVFRNTGMGWILDDGRTAADGNLADSLPPFGVVAIESPEFVSRSLTEEFGQPYTWPSGWESGGGPVNPESEIREGACQDSGLGGGRRPVFPFTFAYHFCFNTVDFVPTFVDLNGDGFVDLVVSAAEDDEALFFGYSPLVDPEMGFSGNLARHSSVSTQVWIQNPNAESGEPRWKRVPDFELPFDHSTVAHFFGEPGEFNDLVPPQYGLPNVKVFDLGVRFGDLNRDGLADVIWTSEPVFGVAPLPSLKETEMPSLGVLLNRGRARGAENTVWCASVAVGDVPPCEDARRYEVPDSIEFTWDGSEVGLFVFTTSLTLADANGDGWLDLVFPQGGDPHNDPANPVGRSTYIHHPGREGSVWELDSNYAPPIDSWMSNSEIEQQDMGVGVADYNADGIVDFVASKSDLSNLDPAFRPSHLSTGDRPDLLVRHRRSSGGSISLSYETGPRQALAETEADALAHANEEGIDEPPGLDPGPFGHAQVVRWDASTSVVSSITVEGFGRSPETTEYQFAHPRWCPKHRVSLGFRLVDRIRPDQSKLRSLFYQNHGRAGRLSRRTLEDGGLEIYRIDETWETVEPSTVAGAFGGIQLPGGEVREASTVGRRVHRAMFNRYANGDGPLQEERFFYDDDHGRNFVREYQRDRPSSPRLVRRRIPEPEGGTGIWGRVSLDMVTESPSGRVLSLRRFSYQDDRGISTLNRPGTIRICDQPRESYGSSCSMGVWLETVRRYDFRGNLSFESTPGPGPGDPRREMQLFYDGDSGAPPGLGHDSHSLPVKVIDPLGNSRIMRWDPVFAEVVEDSSDYQDEPVMARSLDAFGRAIAERRNGELLTEMFYGDHADYPFVMQTAHAGAEFGSMSVWTYDDGHGEVWKRVSEVPLDTPASTGFVGMATWRDMASRKTFETLPTPCVASIAGEPCSRPEELDGLESPGRIMTADALGRVVRVDNPDGGVAVSEYRAGSIAGGIPVDVLFEKNAKGDLSQRLTDGGRLVAVHECSNSLAASEIVLPGSCNAPEITSYDYEPTGELVQISDASGELGPAHQTAYAYDTLGRRISARDPNAGEMATTYDLAGNVAQEIDLSRELTRSHVYDALDRLIFVDTPEGEEDVSILYGENVSQTLMQPSRFATSSYEKDLLYDDHGRLRKERLQFLDTNVQLWKSYQYDLADRISRIQYPPGHTASDGTSQFITATLYEYEGAFLRTVCDENGNVVGGCSAADGTVPPEPYVENAIYDEYGRRQEVGIAGGTRSFTYDPVQRLESDSFSSSGGSYSFTARYQQYDPLSNLERVEVDSLDGLNDLRFTFEYTYDVRNRLSSWSVDGSLEETYGYDALGNLTRHGDKTLRYDHPSKPHAVTQIVETGKQYGYDPAGHVSSITGGGSPNRFFRFDSAGRMVCVSSTPAGAQPGGSCNVLEVEYDASGQRVRERAGATTRYFLGDDLSHVPSEASPGGIAETRIEIEAFGERVGVRLLEGGRIFNGETGPWGVGRPLPLPFPPALLVWALAALAIAAYVAACLLGARIGGDPLGAPVGGTVALIAMVALILPPSAWAGVTGPPEGTVVYRAVLSDPLGSGSVLLDGSGERVRHTVFRPFGAVYEEVGPGFGTSRLDRRYFAGHGAP